MKWWPSKSHLSFCLFLVWENALCFQKHWKVTNLHVLWKLANMSVFSTRQSSAWGFFWEASSLFLDRWVPWDVQDVYRHLLSSCFEAIIHLEFAWLFHLVQTSGGFILPNAVCGQSHFRLLQHLSVTHSLPFLMSINKGNAVRAACHVWRGAWYPMVTANWGKGWLSCTIANWCQITSPRIVETGTHQSDPGLSPSLPRQDPAGISELPQFSIERPPNPQASEPKQVLL